MANLSAGQLVEQPRTPYLPFGLLRGLRDRMGRAEAEQEDLLERPYHVSEYCEENKQALGGSCREEAAIPEHFQIALKDKYMGGLHYMCILSPDPDLLKPIQHFAKGVWLGGARTTGAQYECPSRGGLQETRMVKAGGAQQPLALSGCSHERLAPTAHETFSRNGAFYDYDGPREALRQLFEKDGAKSAEVFSQDDPYQCTAVQLPVRQDDKVRGCAECRGVSSSVAVKKMRRLPGADASAEVLSTCYSGTHAGPQPKEAIRQQIEQERQIASLADARTLPEGEIRESGAVSKDFANLFPSQQTGPLPMVISG